MLLSKSGYGPVKNSLGNQTDSDLITTGFLSTIWVHIQSWK